jgi:hypothetical protein
MVGRVTATSGLVPPIPIGACRQLATLPVVVAIYIVAHTGSQPPRRGQFRGHDRAFVETFLPASRPLRSWSAAFDP